MAWKMHFRMSQIHATNFHMSDTYVQTYGLSIIHHGNYAGLRQPEISLCAVKLFIGLNIRSMCRRNVCCLACKRWGVVAMRCDAMPGL